MDSQEGNLLKQACNKHDIHTIHRIISKMNKDGAWKGWNDIANGFFNLESAESRTKRVNLCNEILRAIRDYIYYRPVDNDEETNLALQVLQMMMCGSESNPWPYLQFEEE